VSFSVRTKTASQADKMLSAAARLFGTQRFHEVRMEDIAAEAEVGKGTLYRYFSDKEELYLALLERATRQFVQRMQEAVATAPGARARLVAYVEAIVDFFDHQPHLFDIIQRAEVLRAAGKEFPWQLARDEANRVILEVFEQGRQQGEFTVRNPELASLMFQGGLRAVIVFGKRPRERDLARHFVDGFLDGADAGKRSKKPLFQGYEG
jgi:AcrR family transcriptional regulator